MINEVWSKRYRRASEMVRDSQLAPSPDVRGLTPASPEGRGDTGEMNMGEAISAQTVVEMVV